MAALAVLVFAGFAGSGARVFLPDAREAARGVAPMRMAHRRATESGVRVSAAAAAIGGRLATILRLIVAWVYGFPFLAKLPALRGLAPGATAHDGVVKRRRWASLGGHGRNGPG